MAKKITYSVRYFLHNLKIYLKLRNKHLNKQNKAAKKDFIKE